MSKIEVNQISSQCGSTLTIGQSGDTVTLACGASQTGFGRTGTVNWDTTAKTAGFTAVSGNGYFVNTTSGEITMNLPATPSAGDIVSIKDYAYTFGTNNFIVDGNGSPIGGTAGIIPVTYSTNGTSKTFVYVDGTKGWLVTNESTDTSQEQNAQFVTATGGTVTCCGDYKIHTFTGPGTFCVSCAGNACGSNTVDYLVVAGGGASAAVTAGGIGTGGGGAGGLRFYASPDITGYPGSPLNGPAALPVSVTAYPITVGGGGTPGPNAVNNVPGGPGSNSIFSTITSAGGGGGGSDGSPGNTGESGGSGGGSANGPAGASGNTPPVSPPQGNNGGCSACTSAPGWGSGGGGGALAIGGGASGNNGGPGGIGAGFPTTFVASNGEPSSCEQYFSGGGGAGAGFVGNPGTAGTGGLGGGGDGKPGSCSPTTGNAGTANTGGGGGGVAAGPGCANANGGLGGSGIVIIRYKYQ